MLRLQASAAAVLTGWPKLLGGRCLVQPLVSVELLQLPWLLTAWRAMREQPGCAPALLLSRPAKRMLPLLTHGALTSDRPYSAAVRGGDRPTGAGHTACRGQASSSRVGDGRVGRCLPMHVPIPYLLYKHTCLLCRFQTPPC